MYRLYKLFIWLSLAFWAWILLDLFTHPVAAGPNEGGNPFRWMSALAGSATVVTALFIMRRVSGNPVGPLLLAWGVGSAGWSIRSEWVDPGWGAAALGIFILYFLCISCPAVVLMCFYFPDGKAYPPRLERWIPVIARLLAIAGIFGYSTAGDPGNIANPFVVPVLAKIGIPIFLFGFLIGMSAALVSLVLRYRVGDVRQRLQLKWLAWLLGVAILLAAIDFDRLFGARFGGQAIIFSFLFWQSFPALGIGIALLRHNLWGIEIIIRRTLVYSLLTGLLGLVYFGGVALMQGILTADRGRLTGGEGAVGSQPSAVVIVVTTLAIAALFNPLRTRIQDFIDRRFYRQKYNSEQALAQFATAARSQADLDHLVNALTEVTQNTLQPQQVSLWLKSIGRPKEAR